MGTAHDAQRAAVPPHAPHAPHTLTPLDPAAHADTVWQLARARDIAALGHAETTRSWITGRLTAPGADPLRDGRLCRRPGTGTPLGAVWLTRLPGVAGCTAELVLAPGAGLTDATRLLDFAVERCAAPTGAGPAVPVELSCFVAEHEHTARAALRARGFGTPRAYHRMSVTLDQDLPRPASVPGAVVRPPDGEADLRAFHRMKNTAFAAGEAGKEEDSFDDWVAWWRSAPGVDPAQCALLELDGRAVGFANITDRMLDSRGVAYVQQIGVAPQVRGRGLGSLLLRWVMDGARRRGRGGMVLTVDAANTPARALYRRLGWTVESRWDDLHRTVAPAHGTRG